jgi:hypothetical protein
MKTRLRKPSPTLVIACLALFVAMTGTGIAANKYLITSTKQIKPSVLKQLKGAKGPRGAKGPAGAAGVAGSTGASGVGKFVKRTAEGAFGTNFSKVTASCNSGEVATGGGADWNASTSTGWPVVSYSVPDPYNAATPTGWAVEIDNMGGSGTGVQAIAWVFCATP